MHRLSHATILATILLGPIALTAQSPTPGLSPDQQSLFDQARKDFGAEKYKEAIAEFQTLHTQLPANTAFPKFAAEAAVDTGDFATVKSLLDPILAASPDDPQALGILAHDAAQSHDTLTRDATLAHLQKLHDAGTLKLQSLILEDVPSPNGGHIRFFYYLEPWSRYKVYLMARLYDATGKQVHRVTLESSDFDQPMFAKEHPDDAAKGVRRFSMDGYSEFPASDGQPATQTHSTYGFFDGRLAYDDFRKRVLDIAAAKRGPMSTTSGIPSSTQSH